MKVILVCLFLFLCGSSLADEGVEYYDYNRGAFIEITDGEIESGENIEYYDSTRAGYFYGEITGVDANGDLEVVEFATGRILYWEEN